MRERKKHNYKPWLDFLIALAILLVVLSNLLPDGTDFYTYISPVKMPLFFAVSGYIMNVRKGDFGRFFLNLLLRIILPCLVFGLIPALWYVQYFGTEYITQQLYDLVYSPSFWLIPGFIIGKTLFYLCRKAVDSLDMPVKNLVLICLSLILTTVGLVCMYKDILDDVFINRAMMVQVFFLFGYLFQVYEQGILSQIHRHWILPMAIIYIILCWMSDAITPEAKYSAIPISLLGAAWNAILSLSGLFMLFCAASKLEFCSVVFYYVRKNMFLIYLWYIPAIHIVVKICKMNDIQIVFEPLIVLILTIWAFLFCIFVGEVLRKIWRLIW
ncbi:MAG: acyltransferase [Bacteroidaceae bacterium]|nr:acyltransferase [Bacteroidaceae bacterium]